MSEKTNTPTKTMTLGDAVNAVRAELAGLAVGSTDERVRAAERFEGFVNDIAAVGLDTRTDRSPRGATSLTAALDDLRAQLAVQSLSNYERNRTHDRFEQLLAGLRSLGVTIDRPAGES